MLGLEEFGCAGAEDNLGKDKHDKDRNAGAAALRA